MRRLLALALTLAATPAFAGWNIDIRPTAGIGTNTDAVITPQFGLNTALSPLAVGPMLDLQTSFDLGTPATMNRTGIGLRQNLPLGLSASAHALLVGFSGPSDTYRYDLGLEGSIDKDLIGFENSALGLHTYLGATPTNETPTLWWAGAGVMLRFGS